MSVISVDLAGSARQFSPIVWRGCEMSQLTDRGLGYFVREDFQAAAKMIQSGTGTFLRGSDLGGSLALATGGTVHNRVAVGANGMAKTAKNGGNQWWFEAETELDLAANTSDMFSGMADDSSSVLLDASIGVTSGKLGFGFLKDSGADTVSVVALRSTGTVSLSAAVSTMVASTRKRFGMRFNGRDQIDFFVDGVKVHSHTLVAADAQSAVLGPVVAVGTRTGAVRTATIDWMAAAYRDDP